MELVYGEPELKEQGPEKVDACKEGLSQVKQEENHPSTDAWEREACSKTQGLAARYTTDHCSERIELAGS